MSSLDFTTFVCSTLFGTVFAILFVISMRRDNKNRQATTIVAGDSDTSLKIEGSASIKSEPAPPQTCGPSPQQDVGNELSIGRLTFFYGVGSWGALTLVAGYLWIGLAGYKGFPQMIGLSMCTALPALLYVRLRSISTPIANAFTLAPVLFIVCYANYDPFRPSYPMLPVFRYGAIVSLLATIVGIVLALSIKSTATSKD